MQRRRKAGALSSQDFSDARVEHVIKGVCIHKSGPLFIYDDLVEAAEQLHAFSAYFLCQLHLEQLQLDELYAVLRASKRLRSLRMTPSSVWSARPTWVWTAMDPTSKLLVVVDVGSRTLAMAQRVVHQVTEMLAPGCVPLFLTDGLKDYAHGAS